MKIKTLTRFNGRDPDEVFEARDADAKKWIDGGYAEKAKGDGRQMTDDGKKKSKKMEGPPEDKAVKKDKAVTK